MSKRAELLALAKLRQATRWPGYTCIGDYHSGAYECDHVSPYTKHARNVDAEIMVLLQDWASEDWAEGPFDLPSANEGYGGPTWATNRNLMRLLSTTFGLELPDTYGTNLFPFVKPGKMSASIPQRDLERAASEFALPQIRIVNPKLVICLGQVTFNALRHACGLPAIYPMESTIGSPFNIGTIRVWCQAHTGSFGQNNRNRGGVDRVSQDWLKMKGDFDGAASATSLVREKEPAGQAIHSDTGRRVIRVADRREGRPLGETKMKTLNGKMSGALEYREGGSQGNDWAVGAAKGWAWAREGIGLEAAVRRLTKGPTASDFFDVVWQINGPRRGQVSTPEIRGRVGLMVESPRQAYGAILNELRRDVIRAVLASDARRRVWEKFGNCADGVKTSDADLRDGKTTTVFTVQLHPSHSKATLKENIQVVHDAVGKSVWTVLQEFIPRLEEHFGHSL